MTIKQQELNLRMDKFRNKMNQTYPTWELACITSDMNLYYFTGTIQRGMLMISRNGKAVFWVRKSMERAHTESEFEDIRPMNSFRTAIAAYPDLPNTIYLEKNISTLQWYDMFSKYFKFETIIGIDRLLQTVRAVKTDYEIDLQKIAEKNTVFFWKKKSRSCCGMAFRKRNLRVKFFWKLSKWVTKGFPVFPETTGICIWGMSLFRKAD
jgi:Xaa-Pro aminopeptidase